MVGKEAFVKEIRAYLERSMVTDRGTGRQYQPTQKLLSEKDPAMVSRKLNNPESLTDKDVRSFCSTLVNWQCITRRTQLLHLFDLGGYTLPDHDWPEEPWKYLIDDTQPSKVTLLPLQNASFENWKNKVPVKWLCNTKTGWIEQVPGREAKPSSALEIGGNANNREWVYCRTRETQDIRVLPNSKVSLSFWAKKTQEGRDPEREKNVEVAYYVDFGWKWEFSQELAGVVGDNWMLYETGWWDVPAYVQRVAVGVVVRKDGAFQVDDIELHMRVGR